MKIFTSLIIVLFSLSLFQNTYGQDYLEATSTLTTRTTTDNSKAWTDVTSVTIDVTDISAVFLSASINMRPDGSSTLGREANYRIYRSDLTSDNSGVIKRQMINNSETGVESWGVGTLVYIFDTSALTGNKTYVFEHSNQGTSQANRNVYTSVRLTAIALTTELTTKELSNDIKSIGDAGVTTTSATFETVTGITSSSLSLPIAGNIFVSVSINCNSTDAGSVVEYQLQYSTNGGSGWSNLGKPLKRSMINRWDDGIISMVALLQNQDAGSEYQIRLTHKRVSGDKVITTKNVNLAAFVLSHTDGHFPAFYSEVGSTGVDITGVSTPAAQVLSTTFTTVSDISSTGPGLYVNTQYLVSASGLNEGASPPQRMRAKNQLYLNYGGEVAYDSKLRYIPDNSDYGCGCLMDLIEDLTEDVTYTISMKHDVDYVSNPDGTEDEVLNSADVILTGFQTYDKSGAPLGIEDLEFAKGINIFATQETIEIINDKPIDATIYIYTILGQLISTNRLNYESSTSIPIPTYKGIAIVSIITNEGLSSSKKVILR